MDNYLTTNSTISYLHPVNLALLQHFFNDSVGSITDDTLYSQPVMVKIPHFHIYSHNFQKIIAKDQKDQLSLQRLVQSVKNKQTIFQTLTESLLDGQIRIIDDKISV